MILLRAFLAASLAASLTIAQDAAAPPATPAGTAASASPADGAHAAWKARDFAKALELLAAPALAEDAAALVLKARMTEGGQGLEASLPAAAELFRRAMEKGSADGKAGWARFLLSGTGGVPADPARAVALLQEAAEAGSGDAMTVLGEMALRDTSREKNAEEAAFWFQKAAVSGHAAALRGLASLHDAGIGGLPRDPRRASLLLREAGRLGDALAMNELGLRYQSGTGVPADETAALGWFLRGAQYGSAAAMVNLGICYENAAGCARDYDLAGRHFAAAAKLGHPIGQFCLAELFAAGRGTPPNPVFAYVNFERAARGGHDPAVARRDAIRATLSTEQLAEAERLLSSTR